MQWYYVVSDQRVGPVNQPEFEQLIRDGTINGSTLVWREGMPAWQPYAEVAPNAGAAPVVAVTGEPGAAEETEMCAASGKRYPKREMIQYEGKWISGEHRDAYFQRMREGVTQKGAFSYGNFGRRFVAKLLDGIILWMVSMVVNVALAAILYGGMNFLAPDPSQVSMTNMFIYQGVSTLCAIGIGLAYSIFFIRRYDATPGKMALGLKLIRPDGSSLSIGRIIGRYFAEWISSMILLIGYIMAGFDDERRALHDRICETRVIKVR
jgi:uncharacterized RDD family membrane protein YckC